MNKYNFCTLFDKGYLLKGLALYQSLAKFLPDFTLWILCMDEESYEIISRLNLPHTRPIRLSDFENANPELKEIKKTRSSVEYCWTLSPSLPLHIIKTNDIPSITYLDSDLFFYTSPEVIFKEAGKSSISIIAQDVVESRKGNEGITGKYNVGMLIFKKDENSLACLKWWKEKCDEWCYDRPEPERYGDQKYLDYFEEKFQGVHIVANKGAGVAPWNVEKKEISERGGAVFVEKNLLVFFHFSRFFLYPPSLILPYGPDTVYNYTKSGEAKNLIYKPYALTLYAILRKVRGINPEWKYGLTERPPFIASVQEFLNNSMKYPLKKALKKLLKINK